MFQAAVLTRHRVRLAYAIAVTADVLQWLLGPLGWAFADQILDVAAMILTWRVLAFHALLLPTFVIQRECSAYHRATAGVPRERPTSRSRRARFVQRSSGIR